MQTILRKLITPPPLPTQWPAPQTRAGNISKELIRQFLSVTNGGKGGEGGDIKSAKRADARSNEDALAH